MATDTTHLPQGELNTDAGNDMAGSELEFGAVQLAQATADSGQPVQLPQGQPVVLVPVQPGQALILPTESANGLVAKIGPEGNLAFVIDGRTIIFQGYVQANDQSPVRVLTTDGDQIDVADVIAATDTSLDIQTAAGPAAGAQGDSTVGSGIYTPFAFGPALGGLNAIGVLDATALAYKNIDDERRTFTKEADDEPDVISITFDELGGIVNEDDLIAIAKESQDLQAAKLVGKNNNGGNDAFDPDNAENEPGDIDGNDGNPDPDREPLLTVATVTVNFGDDVPGKLSVGAGTLPGGLTSDGEVIKYQVLPASGGQGNGIVAFVDGAGGTKDKFDEGIDRVIFDIKVQQDKSDSKFDIHFTLHDNIDNAAPDKNSDGESDLLGGNEQILKLPVQINVVDSDGSPASAVMNLGVIDDVPFFGAAEYYEGEGGISVVITPGDSGITHDESKGVDDDANDKSWGEAGGDAGAATGKALGAGFGLPYGDSQGAVFPKGIAQTQALASFGADGASQEQSKGAADSKARNSIFGELEDRIDADGDGINDGENERPFELFMIKSGSGAGAVPGEDNLATGPVEGNLTIADQPTNATVSWTPWGGGETEVLQVYLRQIDAQTIVGYVIPPEGEEQPSLAREVDLGNGLEAVFVITIDDNGKMTFVQYHQINHATDGPTGPDHDDDFAIRGEDGTPVIQVRISDYDGDHATQPVNLVIQDDGPKFCGVDWGCDNDSKYGTGLIDEDKLQPNGNNDWAPGDDKGGKHADGKINFNFGVDKPGHLEVHGLTVKDSAGLVVLSLSVDENGDLVGANNLKTADGQSIEIVREGPDADGIVTWKGIAEDDSEVFTLTIDTKGYDLGEFEFCLHQALSHPYQDSDSQNDGPQKSFEDNLKFDFNIRGYDVDGDWADGSIKVNVDDDSPKAECDYECVVEGKTQGELNYVTGNIVTGDGNTIFGNDSNNLDGNADSPGADQPYTISKISHGGNTYELSADGQTVSGLNADDSFDATTGILTIKTAEGGTLEIVLVSNNQDEVGDYKYTVPADADHDTDKHAGPANEAASMSDAFDTVGEWEASFAAAGIVLVPSGGTLGLRDLDISGDPYRGIGVGSGEGDNNEVDNNGPDEKLTLQIANPTNNIELTIGSLYNGAPDAGAMENLRWEVYNGNILIASGEILGTTTGLVTLDIDTLLPFDKVVLKPADNGEGEGANNSDFVLVNAEICCPKDKFTEEFDYTLQDADGDEACATLKVDVKDTEPKVPHHDLLTFVNVDEDGLPKGIGNNDSPLDAPGNSASFSGNIPFTPGADPVTIELSIVGGPDTGLRTLDGQKVLATWDSVTGTLIGYIEGTDASVAANQVFKMHITDAQSGAFDFDLLQPVKHADKELLVIDNTENLFDQFFIVKADIEDKDCDVASTFVKVIIDDDMPVITPCDDQNGPINLLVNGSFEQLGTEDGGVLEQGGGTWGVFNKIPGWTSGHDSDPSKAGMEIQNNGALGSIDAQQGNQYLELDSDQLNPGDPNPASTNASVHQDVTTQDGNNYVLSFFYSPREGNPASDGVEVWFDGQHVATINSGTVGQWTEYKFVVEAGEGDATPDKSRLEFKAVGTGDELGGFIDNVSLSACARVDEDDLVPNGIEGGPGDDGVDIGTVFNGSLGVNFGADEGKSIVFSGNDNDQPNLKSGGQEVNYEWVGAPGGLGTLIAYTGNNPNDVSKQVFKVEVTSLEDGGQYTFTLLKPLDHPDTNNNPADNKTDDGKGSYEDNLVFELKFSATDRDGDTADGHLRINVDDDSPVITNGEGSFALATDETKGGGADVAGGGTRAENDETLVAIPGSITGQPGLAAANAIGAAQSSAAGMFNAQVGADQPGTSVYSLVVTGGGATGLIDTATNTAITLVAGPGGTILGKANGGAGDVVFAFSIDGSGNMTMVQYRAVNHGAQEAAPGEHDEAISMAPGVLGVTLTVTDKDGDAVSHTRDVSGSISIDDDGPHAVNDVDSVTEGPGNAATGNVVTGVNPENALLGTDGNGTDGNADNPGQDKPYTISKLTHDGHNYTLSADGLTVLKDGSPLVAPDSFGGGKLTITTAEGGVFEIVMKSNTQSEVGEYKYTPGNPIHAEDVHVGPSAVQSNTDAFNTIGEWTTAFSNGGITLSAQGGNLTIKDVSISGPNNDYRGVGITTGLDGGEVDTDNEKLTLTFDNAKFPGGVNNAEVQLGALFDGVQYDSGSQEIVRWEAYNGGVLVASGQIVGDFDGLVTLDIDTDTNFNKIVLTPLNNGAGDNGNNSDFVVLNVEVCKQEPVCEEFGYTLRDGDGDESTATLKINVEDTAPTAPQPGSGTLSFIVDEDGLPGGIGNSDSPFDADEGDAGNDDAKFSGNIPFTPGADPVTIELFVGEPGTPGGGDTGLDTLDGKNVYAAWDEATGTLIGYIQGTDPSDAANRVFTMKITDAQTGAFDFQLLKPIEHPNTDAGNTNDNTENSKDPSFTVNVQIEDKDCDVAFTSVQVTIDDDMPVITQSVCGTIVLAVDESLDGNTSKDNTDAPGGGTTPEGDEDNFSLPSALTKIDDVIGAAQANASGLFTVSPGADGLETQSFALKVTGGGATGLIDTLSGQPITLVQNGSVIEGRVGATTTVAFAFTVNSSGEVSMAQYRAVNHGNDEPAPGVHDEVKTMNSGVLAVVLSVTDKDGDTVTAEKDISGAVTFDDDGPKANIEKKDHDGSEVTHDESAGLDNDDQPNANLPAVFSAAGLLGWARSDDPVVTTSGSDYGQDGAGSTTLALKVSAAGVDSGLDDTATGNNILLFQNGSIVEGRVSGTGELVFAVSINANGTVDVAQYRAIEHPNPNDDDEDVGISNSALQAWVTVTDKDGDSATDSVDIGSRVRFDDDAPNADIDINHEVKINLDESVGKDASDLNAHDELDTADPTDIGYAKVGANVLFDDDSTFGTDGAGTKAFKLVINGGSDSGLDDTLTNSNVLLSINGAGTLIQGRSATGNNLVFTIAIDPLTGEVTVTQFRAVEHNNSSDHDEPGSSAAVMSGNKVLVELTVTDKDLDSDKDTADLGSIIRFEDDGPVAVADTDSVSENGVEHAYGNVFTGANVTSFGSDTNATDGNKDDAGTDGLQSIQWKDGGGFDGNGNIVGTYGTLFVDADGDYRYEVNNANKDVDKLNNGQTLEDVFTYVITDKDGDTSTSTLKITINGKTDAFPPVAGNVTATVDEDGLSGGNNLAPAGDDNANSAGDTNANEAIFHNNLGIDWKGTPGDIALTAGDWTALRTIDNHTIIVDPASTENLLIGRDSVTNEKVFEVQIINETTGEYEVRLLKPLMHPDSNNNPADNATDFGKGSYEDNLIIPVNVKYTSIGGSIDRALSIDVDDDSPSLFAVSWNSQTHDDEGSPLPGYTGIDGATAGGDVNGTVNTITYTVSATGGADGIDHFEIDLGLMQSGNSALRATDGTSDGAAIVFAFEGAEVVGRTSGGTEVLRVSLSGNQYTVTQSSPLFHTGQGEQNLDVILGLKVVDRDGDTSTYPYALAINDDMPNVTINTQFPIPQVVLDESPAGTDPDGDSNPAGRATHTVDFSGNFTSQFGADGAADAGAKTYALELTGSDVPSGLYALTADGTGQGTQIVLNKVGNDIVGSANGDTYFTISVDGDGKVTFTQSENVWHANASNDDDTSSLHTAAADALKLTLTVKDGDNDTVSASINLGQNVFEIEDDGPTAVNDNASPSTAASSTADVQFIVDISGSMDGAVANVPDFPDNRLGLARYSMFQLLLTHPEILNVQFVKFDDDVDSPTSIWLSNAAARAYIQDGSNFVGGGNTNYDLALAEAISDYGNSPRPVAPPAPAAHQNLVYFLSDGAPNDGGGIQDGAINPADNATGTGNVTREEWEAFATANNITNVFAIGIGDGVNVGNLEPIAFPNTDTNPNDGNEDRVVVIPNSDLQNLTETLDSLLGDVLTPVTGDVLSNDNPGTDGYATPELVSVTYNAVVYDFDPATEHTIDLGAGRGSLKIDQDGDYTYTPPPVDQVDGTPFFVEYTIRDRDGDTSTAKINIDLDALPTTDLNGAVAGDDVTVGFIEQTPAAIAPLATVTVDGGDLESMTVTLINRPNGNAAESLSIPALPVGLTAVYTAATGVLEITGTASAATYQSVLQSIVYNNTSDAPNTAPRSVEVVVNDGTNNSVVNTVTINVTAVNDGPDASISAPSYAATEQQGLNLHGTGLSISDVDAGNNDVTVTLSVGAGNLNVSAGGSGVNVSNNNSTAVTLTGTVAEINNLLQDLGSGTIVFTPSGGDNPPASTQLTLKLNDGGNTGGGAIEDSATVTINIANTPEGPVAVTDRIYTNISSLITVQDSLLLKNDTDVDTANASLVVVSANAGGNGDYFDTDPSHAGTSVTFELDIDGGSSFSNGTTKSFGYVVGDPTLQDDGTVNVTYDTSGSINGSDQDDILIGFNTGLNGKAGADHMIGTGTTDLLDYSNVGGDWNLALGAAGSGNANIDGADTYEGIDGIIGGSGKNELTGNAGNNILSGGSGDDKLSGGSGTDTLNGDAGNDTLVYDTQDTFNGGADKDLLDVSHLASVNFTGFADSKIQDIEVLSLSGGSGTGVTLTAADVINFEGGSINPDGSKNGESFSTASVLTITGDANDTVNLNSGGSDSWLNASANGATNTPAGFTLWVHVTSGTNPANNEDAYVLVQNGVNVIPG